MHRVTVPRDITEAGTFTQSSFVKVRVKPCAKYAAPGLSEFVVDHPQGRNHRHGGPTDPFGSVRPYDPDVIARKPGALEKLDVSLHVHDTVLETGDFAAILKRNVALARPTGVISDPIHAVFIDAVAGQGGEKKMSSRPFARAFFRWVDDADLTGIVRAPSDYEQVECYGPHIPEFRTRVK